MEAATEIELHLCYPSPKARAVDGGAVAKLAESIAESGLLQPITVRKVRKSRAGQVCDAFEVIAGMHRVKAFRRLGCETIPAVVTEMDDLRAELALIDENLCHNDLTVAERASALSRRKVIHEQIYGKAKAKGAHAAHAAMGHQHDANANLADAFTTNTATATGRSERTVQREVQRGEVLGEDTLAKVARTSLDKGEELDALAKLAPEARESLITRAASGESVSAKHEVKKAQRDSKQKVLAAVQLSAPEPIYGCVLEDYEWDFEVYSRETGMDRHAGNHYPVSDDAHTASEIVKRTTERMKAAAPDCVIGSWCTVPHLAVALDVMRRRGFEYKSSFVWVKDRIGTGYWNRNKHEIFLIGVRGNIPAPSMGTQFDSVIDAPRAEHSVKPDWQYEFFERHFPDMPKIELNARRSRPGWFGWGLEAPTPAPTDPVSIGKALVAAFVAGAEIINTETEAVTPPASPEPAAVIVAAAPVAVAGSTVPEIDLEIPAFLRRTLPDNNSVPSVPVASPREPLSGISGEASG